MNELKKYVTPKLDINFLGDDPINSSGQLGAGGSNFGNVPGDMVDIPNH